MEKKLQKNNTPASPNKKTPPWVLSTELEKKLDMAMKGSLESLKKSIHEKHRA